MCVFGFFMIYVSVRLSALGDFLCISTPNTDQLNPPFHTFAELRLIMTKIVARQFTDWLAANAQFSPDGQISMQETAKKISLGLEPRTSRSSL